MLTSFQDLRYATRMLEMEVGNGGFAQAVMNCPECFEPAARGYEILGKPGFAAFVRQANELAKLEGLRITNARRDGVERAFAYFREGVFREFDERLESIGWWNIREARLAYVKLHRDELCALLPKAGSTPPRTRAWWQFWRR